MDNLMFAVGFVAQWQKANPKVPNIVVVLGVCLLGYAGYFLASDTPLDHGFNLVNFRAFFNEGGIWALKGVFALQGTSSAASGLSQLNLPASMQSKLPITKGA